MAAADPAAGWIAACDIVREVSDGISMTDNYQNTLERICRHLQRIAGPGVDIRAETNLVDQFALDSVKILDLIMEIEDEFDISIPLNLMAEVQLVSDLASMIERIEAEK